MTISEAITQEFKILSEDIKKQIQAAHKKARAAGGHATVSFNDSQSGKPMTGKHKGMTSRGGYTYAKVDTGKSLYHVPLHQVNSVTH